MTVVSFFSALQPDRKVSIEPLTDQGKNKFHKGNGNSMAFNWWKDLLPRSAILIIGDV